MENCLPKPKLWQKCQLIGMPKLKLQHISYENYQMEQPSKQLSLVHIDRLANGLLHLKMGNYL